MKLRRFAFIPDLEQWDRLPFDSCDAIARTIARNLPSSFQYLKLEEYQQGDQNHKIALFVWSISQQEKMLFALIPGGRVTLGYDRQKPFIPTDAQLDSWEQETITAGFGFIAPTLEAFLDKVMTPLREVTLYPLLMQVAASFPNPPTVFKNGKWFLQKSPTYAKVQVLLEQEGFRLPTSDEWEYACGAGTRTLFRWGDETPECPVRLIDDEGNLPDCFSNPEESSNSSAPCNVQFQPNAFGLLIAYDPYRWEFCAERLIMRGGDGGTTVCVGGGTFVEWLTLATPYHQKLDQSYLQREGPYRAAFRRVYPLV